MQYVTFCNANLLLIPTEPYDDNHMLLASVNLITIISELELNNTIDTIRTLEGTEFLNALKSMDMLDTVNQDNFTIFLPSNEAFKVFLKPFVSMTFISIQLSHSLLHDEYISKTFFNITFTIFGKWIWGIF